MKRTQLITLLLVLFAGIGVASAKPKVAVLGLEVVDKTNSMVAIDAARQVTEGMRLAAKASGPYEVADNSQREFLDEKIINQCNSEARDCLLKMASNFNAAALVYGRLQLSDNKKNFQVSIYLLTPEKGSSKPAVSAPVSASAQDLQNLGKKIYNELVGVTNLGSISIKTRASKGIVYLNGDVRGQLVDGEHKSTQLAEGEYTVRIAADGFKKWEDKVRVKSGQTTVIEPSLEADATAVMPDEDPEDKGSRTLPEDKLRLDSRENTVSKDSRTGWKAMAIGGAVVAAAAGGWWVYEYGNIKDYRAKAINTVSIGNFSLSTECSEDNAGVDNSDSDADVRKNAWVKGCKAAHATNYAAIGVGIGSVVGIVGAYMGYIRGGDSRESSSQATARKRKPRFAITPVVAPNGGGATLRLDF